MPKRCVHAAADNSSTSLTVNTARLCTRTQQGMNSPSLQSSIVGQYCCAAVSMTTLGLLPLVVNGVSQCLRSSGSFCRVRGEVWLLRPSLYLAHRMACPPPPQIKSAPLQNSYRRPHFLAKL